MLNVDDDPCPPPTKEFIRNSLTYDLLPEEQAPEVGNTDLMYLTQHRGRLISGLIQFALINKERIVHIPVLGRLALSVKRNMMNKGLSAQSAYASELDFTNILGLGIEDFIPQLYLLALGRLPDTQAIEHWRFALNNGAKKEAVIYMVCTSPEFGKRAPVAHWAEYSRAYSVYRLRSRVKHLPIL